MPEHLLTYDEMREAITDRLRAAGIPLPTWSGDDMYIFKTETNYYSLTAIERDSRREFEPGVAFPVDDEAQYAIYRRENDKVRRQLGGVTFAAASRVYVGGFKLDCAAPDDDGDQRAWDLYNAAEMHEFAKALDGVADLLAGQGIGPVDSARLVMCHYAGCTLCRCSPGALTDPIRHPAAHNQLDIWITVKRPTRTGQVAARGAGDIHRPDGVDCAPTADYRGRRYPAALQGGVFRGLDS